MTRNAFVRIPVLVILILGLPWTAARADVMAPPNCSTLTETSQCAGKSAGAICALSTGGQSNCALMNCLSDGGAQQQLACISTGVKTGCSFSRGDAGRFGALFAALMLSGLLLRRRARVLSSAADSGSRSK